MAVRLRLITPMILCILITTIFTGCSLGTKPVEVRIDGSSTVFTISEIMAYEFRKLRPDIRITIGVSGTGGGFKKWVRGETDINNASRPIKEVELAEAAAAGIDFVELPIALDGITLVVNHANDWVQCLTVDQLHEIWREGSEVRSWRDINPDWPDAEIILYGPGTDSGTFDYFNEVIIDPWENAFHTTNYSASENDNVLLQGVIGDLHALAYMGYAHYLENQGQVRALQIDGGKGCVEPTIENIRSNRYTPLSRPVYLYVNRTALERPEVYEFVKFYLEYAPEYVERAGFVALPAADYERGLMEIAR